MTPFVSVNQIFDLREVEVPNPFFAALGQCASMPGPPGANCKVGSANTDGIAHTAVIQMTTKRYMNPFRISECGLRIADFFSGSWFSNPQFEIRNPKFALLSHSESSFL